MILRQNSIYYKIAPFKNKIIWAGEMIQFLSHLAHRHEYLSLDPLIQVKSQNSGL